MCGVVLMDVQVLQAVPSDEDSFQCRYWDGRNEEECQNYHHVLLLPQGPGVFGNDVPLNKTVLTCGSNAFRPQCQYRNVSPLHIFIPLLL